MEEAEVCGRQIILAMVRAEYQIEDAQKARQSHVEAIKQRMRAETERKILSSSPSPPSSHYVPNSNLVAQKLDESASGQKGEYNSRIQTRVPTTEKANQEPNTEKQPPSLKTPSTTLEFTPTDCTHEGNDRLSTTTQLIMVKDISLIGNWEASKDHKGILLIANSDDIALQAATGLAEVLVAKAGPTKIGRPLERRLAPRPPGMTVSEKQKTEQVYTCKLCSFSSIYANSLMDHVRTHSGKKGLLCLVCQRTFPDTYRLKRHILSHTGEKKYKCNLCPYATVSSTFLERHVRTHTGEKNFACGVCDYVCARMDTLKRHVNKVHSGNKPMKRIII